MRYNVVSGIVLTLLLIGMAKLAFNIQPVKASSGNLTHHAPIYIEGNSDFTAENGVTGGSGTPSDPYIIEGWEIDASSAHGIEIRNTTASFVIRSVYVHGGYGDDRSYRGILLENVSNGRVKNATVSNNLCGIRLISTNNMVITGNYISSNWGDAVWFTESTNATVTGNILSNNAVGLDLSSSTNATVMDNKISSNEWVGIILWHSTNVTLTGNNMSSDGVFVVGDPLPEFNTHTITPDNLVNGKPLYYYKDCMGVDVDGIPVGQLIIANCSKVRATNLQIVDADWGVQMAYVDDALIMSNEVSNGWVGIRLKSSTNATIMENHICSNQAYGIHLTSSTRILVYHNNFVNHYPFREAYDDSGNANAWDNGYPSGGNYWDIYTGFDLFSGPHQDEAGSDGIGDRSYAFDGENRDNYPLMHPWSYYELTVTSSPITTIPFTIDETNRTTPYTDWLPQGSHTLEMPETHNRHVWSHWLEDEDTNRTKTVTMNIDIALTAIFTPDNTPPSISIVSPENKTYPADNVSLNLTMSESASWIGYSLDGQMNVTITGNTTLSTLSDGSHNLIIYAKDKVGNIGASEIVCFTIEANKDEFFSTWSVVTIAIITVVGAAFLVYFAKIKKTTHKGA